jgi:hypothetical protein
MTSVGHCGANVLIYLHRDMVLGGQYYPPRVRLKDINSTVAYYFFHKAV